MCLLWSKSRENSELTRELSCFEISTMSDMNNATQDTDENNSRDNDRHTNSNFDGLIDFRHLPQITDSSLQMNEAIFANESGHADHAKVTSSSLYCSNEDAFRDIKKSDNPSCIVSSTDRNCNSNIIECNGNTAHLTLFSDHQEIQENDKSSSGFHDVGSVSASSCVTVSRLQPDTDDAVLSYRTEGNSCESIQLVSLRHISENDSADHSVPCSSDLSEPLAGSEIQDGLASNSDSSRASFCNFVITDEDSEPFGSYEVNPEENGMSEQSYNNSQENGNEFAVSSDRQRIGRKRLYRFSSTSSEEDLDTSVSSSSSSGRSSSRSSSFTAPKACKLEEPASKPVRDVWKQTVEIFRRQLGRGTSTIPDVNFQRRVGGSLSLVQKLQIYVKYERHKGCVNALNFNETGTLIASGSDDLQIVIWDWVKRKSFIEFDSGHRANVFQAKFMPYTGDCHIVSCARDGQVRLAQLSVTGTCKGTKKLAQHKGAAHKLAIMPDSCHVFLSCGEDGVTYQIDLRQEKPNRLYTTKENGRYVALYSIHTNPFNMYEHCVGGRDQFIRIYDTRMTGNADTAKFVKRFCPHRLDGADVKSHVTCAVYNYNGTAILGTYNDDDIYLFDNGHSDGADYIHKYVGHRNSATVKGVNFYGPKSQFVVSGSDCGNVFLWDVETEAVVNYFHADENGVINVLEPHPHIPMLATSGLDNDVKLWMPVAEHPSDMQGLSKVMKKNKKDRERELNEPELIDSEMLWFLMHRLRRSAARFQEEGTNDSSSDDDSPEENSISEYDDGDDDDDDNASHPVQCSQS